MVIYHLKAHSLHMFVHEAFYGYSEKSKWLICFFSQADSCIWPYSSVLQRVIVEPWGRVSHFIQCNYNLLIKDTKHSVILNIKERERSHKVRRFSVTPGWREHQVSVHMEERLTGDRRQSSEIKQLFLVLALKSRPLLYPEFTSIGLCFLAPSWPFWDDCHSFLVTIKQTAQQEGLTTHIVCESVFRLGYKSKRHESQC